MFVANGEGGAIIWQVITDLGDSAVTFALAAFILLHLVSVERWRQACAWILMIAVFAVGIFVIKLLFRSCIMITAVGDISGHTAMSTIVYGGFAQLMLAARPVRWPAVLAALSALLLVGAIAVSRIALHAHEWWEVAAGFGAGLLAILLFGLMSGRVEGPPRLVGLMVGAAAMAALVRGAHLPVDVGLNQLAEKIHVQDPRCLADLSYTGVRPSAPSSTRSKRSAMASMANRRSA